MADRTEVHAPGLEGYRALAHPLRVRIVRMVRERPMSASALARELDILPGSARYHLRTLERAGIAQRAGERTIRGGREVLYSAPDVVRLDDDVAPAVRRAADRAYLQDLGAVLDEASSAPGGVAGFSLQVRHLRPGDVAKAERIVMEAGRRFAALDHPDDPTAQPHAMGSQLVRLPPSGGVR
jgi:DNA-binding transcriptional ArsR family regulator